MGIISFINRLFGNETEKESQQSSPHANGKNMCQNDPNLGKGIHIKEEHASSAPKEEPPTEVLKDSLEKDNHNEDNDTMTSATYNLIILDESGSMSGVRMQTITGCNETLNSIRNTAKEHPEIKQYVSIFCFDTSNSRYVFQDVPVEKTRDLTTADYCPNACTPLYDAIGYTVTQLDKLLVNTESVGLVTIITDGYENASRRWKHQMVIELIESLKRKGWVFTFIGANIDVERTATGLGIDSYMEFDQTEDGMAEMFEIKRRSDMGYNAKRFYMEQMRRAKHMSAKQCEEAFGNMNHNYFMERERVAPEVIRHLDKDEIFVFGSNVDGQHNVGASLYALEHFGAVNGQAEGCQGQSYAIPTVGNSFDELKAAITRFNEYVVMHPQNKFVLSAIGCADAGYGVEQIAPLFRQAYSFGNVYVPQSFLKHVCKDL